MKKIMILIILVSVNLLSGATDIKSPYSTPLPDMVRPRYFWADNRNIYIMNSFFNMTAFSVQDLKKSLQIISRKGDGPTEFRNVPMVLSIKNNIILKTTEKIAYYSMNGKYLFEKKLKKEGVINPLAENYLFWYFGVSKGGKEVLTYVDIENSNQVKLKNIYQYKAPKMNSIVYGGTGSMRGKFDLIREKLKTFVWEDKVFIGDPSRGFYIAIFDKNGNAIREISKNEPKIKITEQDKDLLIKKAKNEWTNEDSWKIMLKSNDLYTPEYFPPYETIMVANNTIYVKTFQSKENKKLFIILDIKGNELGRTYLPESDFWAFQDNRYYFLSYSEDDDEWSLNRIVL